MANNIILFIDANQYMSLYGLVAGKRLLDWLEEQQDNIFVSAQIVEEVLRRKLGVAQTFFLATFKEIDATKVSVPDHLLGIGDEKTTEFRKIFHQFSEVKSELLKLANDALAKISRSEDDVSQRLKTLFDKAVLPSTDEMQHARERKERGNPPGKQTDTLGDQITWEQLLTRCKGGINRVWIITNDRDYCIKQRNLVLLNSLLYRDLTNACGVGLELHCYTDLLEGITEFRKNVGVTADKLPTEQEATEIKKELEALPPLGWLNDTMMARPVASNSYQRWRASGATQFSDDAWMAFAAESMQGVPPGKPSIALRESAAEEPTQSLPTMPQKNK